MADDAKRNERSQAMPTAADLQNQLTRAYMSGNGAEVERLLALINAAEIKLPPKTRAAA
jgi:hypothetical protein